MNYAADLDELDRIWPLGKQLIVPNGGTVLVAGAYEGRYVDYITSRYFPKLILGFEPQESKAAIARTRLNRHWHGPVTSIIDRGLGVHTCVAPMENQGTDGCRVCNGGEGRAHMLDGVDAVLDEHGPIDLFICNMEGYEIPLLAYLCGSGRISEIKSLAVQFHSDNRNVRDMLCRHYGQPVYEDWPHWCYWR